MAPEPEKDVHSAQPEGPDAEADAPDVEADADAPEAIDGVETSAPDGQREDGRVARAARLRAARRAQVLAVARRVFAERGYHATSVADIIEAAGIARGTFYLYFVSKRSIFDELLDNLFSLLTAVLRRVDMTPGAPPPLEQMRDNMDRILGVLDDNRDLTRILMREAVGLDADFDRKLAEFYGRVTDLIQHALRRGQSIGLTRPCDHYITSLCVLGSVKEVISQALVGTGSKDHPVDRQLIVREIIQYNLNGLFSVPVP
ncbi:MAG: TetR/AcrR family transcriptional regulator [Deltaproteobacteria bacterium]|nr:TetR/AcrR family transcriptional regulator [Deltaproteobacteria bacterium]